MINKFTHTIYPSHHDHYMMKLLYLKEGYENNISVLLSWRSGRLASSTFACTYTIWAHVVSLIYTQSSCYKQGLRYQISFTPCLFLKQSFQLLDHLNYQNNFWRSGITEASMKSDTKLESLLFAQNRIEQERVYRKFAIGQSFIGTQKYGTTP